MQIVVSRLFGALLIAAGMIGVICLLTMGAEVCSGVAPIFDVHLALLCVSVAVMTVVCSPLGLVFLMGSR
jgi:hypothetical protein